MKWYLKASISIVNGDGEHFLTHLHVFKKDFAHFQAAFFVAVGFFGLLTYFAHGLLIRCIGLRVFYPNQ